MRESGLMGNIYTICEWIMRFSVTNLLWILFNTPLVFIGLSVLFISSIQDAIILIPLLLLCFPFCLFPATSAMFALVRDWIIDQEKATILGSFWKYYRENYKKSMQAGVIFTLLWFIWAIDYYYFQQVNTVIMFVFLIMGVILYVFTLLFFTVIVHYDIDLKTLLKKAFILTVGSPVLFFSITIVTGIVLLVSIQTLPIIIPFFTGSLIAFITFSAFYRLFLRVKEEEKG
ncbi:YesL family protein [Oceanobacillus sp. 1P07AA]|uniref:YesL family protein n=1 Tax=Oceanobacillus sp. 1P07AA TaxID=3132293 RepID=UPI0039A4E18F